MSSSPDAATEIFVEHRNLLFTVAYELLGSAADAEDVLQEAWLRWARVDLDEVRDPRAYLVRIVTRQGLDRLRLLGRRRESYVGPWLPEPLLTSPDVADDVELAESVSLAMLLVLETLSPTERAVFVLREVFALGYDELAAAVDKTPAAVRQIAHRAREHVAARRPRGEVSREEAGVALQAFQRAVETGDLQGLVDRLAPDVVLLGDGGGVVPATLEPLVGADRILQQLSLRMPIPGLESIEQVMINGWPALVLRGDGKINTVLTLRLDGALVTGIYLVRNPAKLSRLAQPTMITRSPAGR
ncbi:RNA polymerase sigma-70 factor [Microlunatus speluncae]|uniref:RNA polymerase sigma-70 factor n=1 Tax=Microlunatus speluncae TaxID=2594267 RepID=UPI001266254B|nr:RNA polymerase sigma-70 factor [Microlunatus speluncae]